MGKLHTLRRAIERNPEDWFYERRYGYPRTENIARAARFYRGQWIPVLGWGSSYKSFVKHVLEELGYI